MKTLKYFTISLFVLIGLQVSAQENAEKKECCKKAKTECTQAQQDTCKESKKSCCPKSESKDQSATTQKKVDTQTFKVEGNCTMCKARIENAALIKGVKSAEWDKETEMLTVIFDPQKVDLLTIHNAIADAGHETEKVKANHEVYEKLPACCAYKNAGSSCGHDHK